MGGIRSMHGRNNKFLHNISSLNLKGRDDLGEVGVDGSIL